MRLWKQVKHAFSFAHKKHPFARKSFCSRGTYLKYIRVPTRIAPMGAQEHLKQPLAFGRYHAPSFQPLSLRKLLHTTPMRMHPKHPINSIRILILICCKANISSSCRCHGRPAAMQAINSPVLCSRRWPAVTKSLHINTNLANFKFHFDGDKSIQPFTAVSNA